MYKLIAGVITIFWLVMTGLVVRLEYFPSESRLMEVPVSHVTKLILHHQQSSTLNVMQGTNRIGTCQFEPRKVTEGAGISHRLSFNGHFSVKVPLQSTTYRVGFSGNVDLDEEREMERFSLAVFLRDPPVSLEMESFPREQKLLYSVTADGELLKSAAGTWEELLRDPELRLFGIDPGGLSRVLGDSPAPQLTARMTDYQLGQEKVTAYLLLLESGAGMKSEIYVSQLGQILRVETGAGYSMVADEPYSSGPQ